MNALGILAAVFLAALSLTEAYPKHASCKISWTFNINCSDVETKIVNQMQQWESADNCAQGGEKCLYKLTSNTPTQIKGTHTTPVKKYIDDLTFTLSPNGNGCHVAGFSTSETWYAYLDYSTNYCNLHNLITGSELDKTGGYSETTSDSVCTQFSSADCEKY